MRFKRPPAMEPEIQLAPLIDVILLLLLFYSVAATFTDQASINIDLPRAGSAVTSRDDNGLVIVVEADGRYSLNDRALAATDVDALMSAMSAALAGRNAQGQASAPAAPGPGEQPVARAAPAVRVSIVGDANAPHQAVVRAMDAARRLGITSVSIATREEDQ